MDTNLSPQPSAKAVSPDVSLYVGRNQTLSLSNAYSEKAISLICDGNLIFKPAENAESNIINIASNSVLDLSRAQSITLANNVTLVLKPGATLILGGAVITSLGSATISGEDAVIQAPPRWVFDSNIKVTGTWAIDRAYPQWFSSARVYSTEEDGQDALADNSSGCYDWAEAINKAIRMKNSGEVSLPRGVYTVKSTIYTHYGIRLSGEGATSRKEAKYAGEKAIEVTGTIIMAYRGSTAYQKGLCSLGWKFGSTNNYFQPVDKNGNKLQEPYLVTINMLDGFQDDKAEDPKVLRYLFKFPDTTAIIEYIRFVVNTPTPIVAQNELNGIYAHGSFSLRYLVFEHLATGVYVDSQYSDRQELIGCGYRRGTDDYNIIDSSAEEVKRFAFCRLGNGDAFRMEGCYVGHYPDIGALFMKKCNGGSITDNVFNSHVVLSECTNIIYSGNHTEAGGQLIIQYSTVDASSNYFEKAGLPSIRLLGSQYGDHSVLNLSTSKFIFADGYHYGNETEGTEARKENLINRLTNLSEYDIETDAMGCINLNQNYRNVFLYGADAALPKSHTYGILIKAGGEDFGWFNTRSGFLTPSCQIAQNTVTAHMATIPTTAPSTVITYAPMRDGAVEWLIDPDKDETVVEYKVCILPPGTSVNNGEIMKSIGSIDMRDATKGGVYFAISVKDTAQRGRLYVKRIHKGMDDHDVLKTVSEYEVFVPLCYTAQLYDNGITLSSFKWVKI